MGLALILVDRNIKNYFFSCEYNIPLPFLLLPHRKECSAIICLSHQANKYTQINMSRHGKKGGGGGLFIILLHVCNLNMTQGQC